MTEVRDAIRDNKAQHETFLRDQRDEIMVGVKNARVTLGGAGVCDVPPDGNLGEHIYVGGVVWYQKDKKVSACSKWTIIRATHGEATVEILSCDKDDKTLTVPRNELLIRKDTPAVIAEHIKELTRKGQGFRNLAHVDPQPIIEDFAARWVPMYEEVLEEAVDSIDEFVRGAVAKAFARGRDTDPRTRRAAELLERRATAGLDDLRRDADRCVKRLVRYGQPPLVFTTNEHYLASAFQNVVGDLASKPPTDESNAMLIHARWLAFQKVQSKVIIEAATKDLLGIYIVDFDALVNGLLYNTRLDPAILEAVDPETQTRANQRKRVVADLATLEELVKAFDCSS